MPGTDLGSVYTKSNRHGFYLKNLMVNWGIQMTELTDRKEMVSSGGLNTLLECN